MINFIQYLKEEEQKQLIAKNSFMLAHSKVLESSPSYNFDGKEIKITKAENKSPDDLKEGEYSFYEPGNLTGTKHRGDVIVRWQGKLISYDLKGKSEEGRPSKKGRSGKHQNDYILSATEPLQFKKESGRIKTISAEHLAQLGSRFNLGAKSETSGIQRVFPSKGKEERKVAAQKVKSHIPGVIAQLGTAFTISGSKQGVAVTQHHTEESNKDTRSLANSFLSHIGHTTTHEPHELGTAGSPEFKPKTLERGARGTLRVSLDVNEKTQPLMSQNAKRMYS